MTRHGLAVENAYKQSGELAVAYLDETYNIDPRHPERYYVMSAVIVHYDQRDQVRSDLVRIVGSSFWHTSEALRTPLGRATTTRLLSYLGDPTGSETCVVSHTEHVDVNDRGGEAARERCLARLITCVSAPDFSAGPVELFVLEERRDRRQSNRDARTKSNLLRAGAISPRVRLMQVSPGQEQLLWLPDLVCSAYRQMLVRGDAHYFKTIANITMVI